MKYVKPFLITGVALFLLSLAFTWLIPAAGSNVIDGDVLDRGNLTTFEIVLAAARIVIDLAAASFVGASLILFLTQRRTRSSDR